MQMKKNLLFGLATLLLFSCNNAELEEKVKQLEQENAELKSQSDVIQEENADKDSAVANYIRAMQEIEENIDQLDLQQQALNIELQNGVEHTETDKDRILSKIQLINTMMEQNNKTLNKLANEISKSNLNIASLKENINKLQTRLDDKDSEIEGLKKDMLDLNYEIEDLNVTVDSLEFIAELQRQVLKIQREELEAAYFCFGTKKELKENNIITREGGLIGIGKTTKLSEDFNREYFEQININETTEIPLAVKKVNLITNHPTGSYELVGEETIEKLVITEPLKFWEASKFLVIEVE